MARQDMMENLDFKQFFLRVLKKNSKKIFNLETFDCLVMSNKY